MLLQYLIVGILALGLGVSVATAQPRGGGSIGLKGGRRLDGPDGDAGGGRLVPRIGSKKGRGPGGPPPPPAAMIERWRQMSPEDRQQMVDRLPADRREGFRRRMEMWDSLKPAERKGVSDRFDRFRDLPPDQQKTARQAFRQFNQLAPERRQALRREMMTLRNLNDEERALRLTSEEFRNRYDAQERGLIADLTSTLPD